jgi:hypothetical protein
MMKRFRVWLEEKESRRRIRSMLMDRLGLEDTEENEDIKVSGPGPERVKQAITQMQITGDDLEQLNSLIDQSHETTLRTIIDQIEDIGVPEPDTEEIPSIPAQLPAGVQQSPQQQISQPGFLQ